MTMSIIISIAGTSNFIERPTFGACSSVVTDEGSMSLPTAPGGCIGFIRGSFSKPKGLHGCEGDGEDGAATGRDFPLRHDYSCLPSMKVEIRHEINTNIKRALASILYARHLSRLYLTHPNSFFLQFRKIIAELPGYLIAKTRLLKIAKYKTRKDEETEFITRSLM